MSLILLYFKVLLEIKYISFFTAKWFNVSFVRVGDIVDNSEYQDISQSDGPRRGLISEICLDC